MTRTDEMLSKSRRGLPDDTVTIPRSQYEALMAAAKALARVRKMNQGGDDAAALIDVTCGDAMIALRFAGVQMDGETQ